MTVIRFFQLIICILAPGTLPLLASEHSNLPSKEVTIDTDEGTWINLDVSPDGKTIVFDLLGDIYAMDIKGGVPLQLTSGTAFDTQPRFSPDGKKIAFISDKSGIDNVWLMDSDGRHHSQFSFEAYRKPSAPAWSPDGKFIVVRKHFTSARTIGTGEIWQYSLSDKTSVPLVKPAEKNQEISEPFFSPDGNKLFYSIDEWPEAGFAYDRDAQKSIFSIQKLTLSSGNNERFISSEGGAIRPTPSPDGRYMAYVTRFKEDTDGFPSALVVRDLASGTDTIVYDRLDRDMQQLWSNHGFYPAFSWTPDSEQLVFWAEGKIRKVTKDGYRHEVIPFRIKTTRTATLAPKAKELSISDQVPLKALRWVSVSPDGRYATYQALGKIYIENLDTGRVSPLTASSEGFEHYPSFSPDSEWVVYTTWQDDRLGSVKRTHIETGETVTLTAIADQYTQPAVSPDMQSILFHKVEQGPLMPPLPKRASGVYMTSWDGGTAALLEKSANDPQFCRDSKSVYLTKKRGEALQLVRLNLSSKKTNIFREVTYATNMRISPDCKHLAYIQFGDVYVASLEGEAQATKIENSDGAYLSWTHDLQLHWSYGPQLYSTDLVSLDSIKQQSIGFTAQRHTPEGCILLTGGNLITMEKKPKPETASILVCGNRIQAIGSTGSISLPENTQVVDMTGRTILPGFIDNHYHSLRTSEGVHPENNWLAYAAMAFGVTTAFDPFADTYDIFSTAEMEQTGKIVAPRIYSTGTSIYGAANTTSAQISTYEDALKEVSRRKKLGAIAVKSYLLPWRSQRQHVIAAAQSLGMLTISEAEMAIMNGAAQIMDGTYSLEHAISLDNIYSDMFQLWEQTATHTTPTLLIGLGSMGGENLWYNTTNILEHPILSRFTPSFVLQMASANRPVVNKENLGVLNTGAWINKLQKKGIPALVGGHGQREGLGFHWEMWLMAASGMSTPDVLQAATIKGAEHIGLGKELGSLSVGKLADMVILDANPLEDIRNSEKVHMVMKNGVLYDAQTMQPVNGPRRKAFYWEY